MWVRASLVLCILVPVIMADVIDVQMVAVKKAGKNGNKYRFTGRCFYDMADPAAIRGVTFSVQLDRATTAFRPKGAEVLSSNGFAYTLTNLKEITNRYVLTFITNFETDTNCVLSGNCTMLEPVPTPPPTPSTK